MTNCALCGQPPAADPVNPMLRADGREVHLACAPKDLVVSAAEEYRAILRKGVRYFVEKYSVDSVGVADIGARFLVLGQALESEIRRRPPG